MRNPDLFATPSKACFFLVRLQVLVLSPEPPYQAPVKGLVARGSQLRHWCTQVPEEEGCKVCEALSDETGENQNRFKKKKIKSRHLNKVSTHTFRLQSARHQAICNELTRVGLALESTHGSGPSPALPEAVTTAEEDGSAFIRPTAEPASSLISGRPLTSQLTFLTHIPP